MNQKSIARLAGFSAGVAMVLGFAGPVGAQTVAELQAQIAALMTQLQALSGMSASGAISSNLTVGSKGSEVVVLQNALVAQGYLTMPAGVAPGYFGSLTKGAVARWQAAVGLPSTGYFGPLSRAKFNAGMSTSGTVTGGTVGSGSGTPASGGITTPGAEGTLTVTSAPVSNSTLYVGESMKPVLAFDAKANNSDLSVQRVKIDLGTNTNLYSRVFSKFYVVDSAGNTIASSDLNSSTVVKDSDSRYYITIAGFSSIVPKGTTKNFTIKGDVRSSIDSTYRTSYTVRLAASGVRAVDGAGIDLYSPTNASDVSRSITIAASLTDSATLAVSTSASTPNIQEIVASAGASSDEVDKVELLRFDIRADKDNVEITDLINFVVTNTNANGSGASASTTYLYEGAGVGGKLLGSASVTTSDADFTNISSMIAKGTSKTYTLAADIRSATANQATIVATFTGNSTNVVGLNTVGDTVTTVSGSATGNNALVRNVGPVFSLVGSPTITRNPGTISLANGTSSATATFNIRVTAIGGDILFGDSGSTTMPMVSNVGNVVNDSPSFALYLGGATTAQVTASSTGIQVPSTGVVSGTSNSFTLQQNNTVTVPVTFTFEGRTTAGVLLTTGDYAVGLARINWVSPVGVANQSSFMSGKTEWRTPGQTMP